MRSVEQALRYARIKRCLDVAIALVGLVVMTPLCLVAASFILIGDGPPLVFKQTRIGKNGKEFTLLKLRTMKTLAADATAVDNERRTFPVGSVLRSLSIDEIPQLINVMKGDMSLVGPRPLHPKYLPRYSARHSRRHEVKPGITGLAQISGRSSITWNERLDLDVQYIETMSLLRDLKILLATASAVLTRRGTVATNGLTTADEFMGSGIQLSTRSLVEKDLSTRVAWLKDDRIRDGVSINFQPTIAGMNTWFKEAEGDKTRADYVCLTPQYEIAAMFGLVGIGAGRADLYIYVDPNSLGQGIGRIAMSHLIRVAREQHGITCLELETKTSNSRSIRLYERFGFSVTGPVEDMCKYRMRLNLKPVAT